MPKVITLIGIARTPADQQRGLRGVDNLPLDHGMLFLFPTIQTLQFEMTGVFIPLDLLIIRDGFVMSYEVMHPCSPFRYGFVEGDAALEVPAGTFDNGVVGSRAILDGQTVLIGE
jgi:uncharacterized membrane protein (UPF0127 family)